MKKNSIWKMILESFMLWIKTTPALIGILIKAFLVYSPIVIFWLILLEVDFNGALFVTKLQEMNKENITSTFLMFGSLIFSINLFIWIIFKQRNYDIVKSASVHHPTNYHQSNKSS